MVYHPYFRGKQFELVAIRESAAELADAQFTPIIEPVKEQLSVLKKTLDAVQEAGGSAIVITNPQIGEHAANPATISQLIGTEYAGYEAICPGLMLTEYSTPANALAFAESYGARPVALVHGGVTIGSTIAQGIVGAANISKHIFVEKNPLYRSHYQDSPTAKVLVHDGFKWQAANRSYPLTSEFSELHLTYAGLGLQGFGDFLTVGHRFIEGGGPAYAIAIHISYIDPSQDNVMFVRHFLSDSQSTPTNPAGKFAEAVAKLIHEVDEDGSLFLETAAIEEFRGFHESGHYPGLGYVKKLSIKHHLELMANFLGH